MNSALPARKQAAGGPSAGSQPLNRPMSDPADGATLGPGTQLRPGLQKAGDPELKSGSGFLAGSAIGSDLGSGPALDLSDTRFVLPRH